MSSINGRQQIGAGVGDGYASIDNVPFARGGFAGWPDDDSAFFNDGDLGWVCAIFHQQDRTISRAVADPHSPQYGAGMNYGLASDGQWAAYLDRGPQRGLFTSMGLHFPSAALLGLGAGALAFKADGQSFGPTLVLEAEGQRLVALQGGDWATFLKLEKQLRDAGLLWEPTVGVASEIKLLGNYQAIWQEGQRLKVANLPQPLQVGSAYEPYAFWIGGRLWVSYWSDVAGLVAHPADELVGIVVAPLGVSVWWSARAFGTVIAYALSSGPGEQPGELRLERVDTLTAPRVPLVPQEPLPQIGRPCWIGAFEFDQAAGVAPGNTLVAVRRWSGALPRPFIQTDETVDAVSGDVLGYFLSGSTVEDIEFHARVSTTRPIVYWDARTWPWWPQVPPGSWVCVQAYQRANESLAAFEADLRGILAHAPAGQPIALVCQQYTSNSSLATDIKAQIPVYLRLARDHVHVVALLLFSGYGRAWGLNDHPYERGVWTGVVADTAVPAFEPYPPPHPKPPPLVFEGDLMQFSKFDGSKVIPYRELKKSSRAGCVNVILPNGNVLSAQGDDRPAGTDGPWEQGQVSGNAVTLKDFEHTWTWLIVPVDKLP